MQGVETPYIPRDDESEAALFAAMNAGQGEIVYIDPDEVNNYAMQDFGMIPDEYEVK